MKKITSLFSGLFKAKDKQKKEAAPDFSLNEKVAKAYQGNPVWIEKSRKIEARFKVGDKFTYMGLGMVVCGVRGYFYTFCTAYIFLMPIEVFPAVFTQYVDANGVIRDYEFSGNKLGLLEGVEE
jgi:hypothetical protein